MPIVVIGRMDQIKGAEHEFDVFKKILLQVCLIYTYKIFNSILYKSGFSYNFE